ADLGGAGEGEHAHVRVGGELLADRACLAGDDVEHALGDAGLVGKFGQRERGERRLGGRLAHHGAADRQRGGDLARDHGGGEVPWGGGRHHADRVLGDGDAGRGLEGGGGPGVGPRGV